MPYLPACPEFVQGGTVRQIRLTTRQIDFVRAEVFVRYLEDARKERKTLHGDELKRYEAALAVEDHLHQGRFEFERTAEVDADVKVLVATVAEIRREVAAGISNLREGQLAVYLKPCEEILQIIQKGPKLP